jgi:hypothetical protein
MSWLYGLFLKLPSIDLIILSLVKEELRMKIIKEPKLKKMGI